METANTHPPSTIHSKFEEPSPCSPDLAFPESINVVHHEPKLDRLQEIQEHAQVVEENDRRLYKDFCEELGVFERHKQQKEALIKFLSPFSNMWDGYLGQILTAWHIIELTSENTRSLHSAPYLQGHKVWQFAATDIDKTLR